MGLETPKQFLHIAGKSILKHTVERLRSYLTQAQIIVILDPQYTNQAQNELKTLKNIRCCNGGNSRKQSVYNGLKCISNPKDDDIVLIHDAARPFVTQDDVVRLLKTLESNKAATLSAPAHNTICSAQENNIIDQYQNRDALRNVLTPQGFHYHTILKAHEAFANNEDFTDDTALVKALGVDVILVDGSTHNYKITTQEDLKVAEKLLHTTAPQTRIGTGFDVHAFDEIPATSIRLGGIDIPFDKKLKGHSDADVVLHTVTDALLGAIGAGDIGDHFPPSDNKWKGKDSAYFLERANMLITERGGHIGNIDVTIICEAPKLFPHKIAIKNRIADILSIAPENVNVKATTTEKLGFTGRGEGIAAQASATINL